MTVQYVGNDLYDIHLDNQKMVLSKDDVADIQGFNFETMNENETSPEKLSEKVDNLEDKLLDAEIKIDELEEQIYNLTEQIVEYESKIT